MSDKPSVGRMVHYVSHGTPVREDGSQAFKSECRAAIITQVYAEVDDVEWVSLAVLNPSGVFFHDDGVPFSESPEGGTWHWPERV